MQKIAADAVTKTFVPPVLTVVDERRFFALRGEFVFMLATREDELTKPTRFVFVIAQGDQHKTINKRRHVVPLQAVFPDKSTTSQSGRFQ